MVDVLGSTSDTQVFLFFFFLNDLSALFHTRTFYNRNWPKVPSYWKMTEEPTNANISIPDE